MIANDTRWPSGGKSKGKFKGLDKAILKLITFHVYTSCFIEKRNPYLIFNSPYKPKPTKK